ncbi:hypothetical protein JTB14_036634 [Gonioctena quinquepunctata]|nr:hypothetical protein JTB14_036634 [Gonioctena quinquepunctata]
MERSGCAMGAYNEIESKLVGAPILSSPDFSLPFTSQADASDIGLGSVLTQHIKDKNNVPDALPKSPISHDDLVFEVNLDDHFIEYPAHVTTLGIDLTGLDHWYFKLKENTYFERSRKISS